MRPILFEVPGWDIKVHSYGVMIFLACFAALGMAVWRARRENFAYSAQNVRISLGDFWQL